MKLYLIASCFYIIRTLLFVTDLEESELFKNEPTK